MVTFQVHISQTISSLGHSLFCCFTNKANAFIRAFRQAKVLNVHESEERNAERLTLFGSSSDPTCGTLNVSLGTHALCFHHAHPVLRLHIALICCQPELPICQLGFSGEPRLTEISPARLVAQAQNCQ